MNKAFARRFNAPRLSPEQAERQGRVTRLALDIFGKSETAIAFLNAHHDSLGGRPLDLALASADGLQAVENLLARFSRA